MVESAGVDFNLIAPGKERPSAIQSRVIGDRLHLNAGFQVLDDNLGAGDGRAGRVFQVSRYGAISTLRPSTCRQQYKDYKNSILPHGSILYYLDRDSQ